MSEIKISEINEGDAFSKNFLNRALREIMSIIHAECGSLFLFDVSKKELVMNSFYNSNELHIAGLKHRLGEGVSGKVANTKSPVLVKDIDSDSRFIRNGFSHYRTKSFISIPIFCSEELIGLVNLADKADGKPFSDDDLNISASLLRNAVMVLDSMNTYAALKQEKEALVKQKQFLEKYASVGKLSAGIVHEVNNPLDGIIRYTNMLLRSSEDNTINQEYLLEIKRGLDRIANITKSLLDFSHQINTDSAHPKKYIDIRELIEETITALGSRDSLSHIKIIKHYAQNLPKVVDLGLSHIIVNIIKNALDAMPQSGRLIVSADIRDTDLEISIADTGCGIKPEVIDKIFEPFFTTKTKDKGCGLGLAICNEVVGRYKGKIKTRSSVGEGSDFTVVIPRKYTENA